jgi:thiol-disulfide isomerase/thioredoxin
MGSLDMYRKVPTDLMEGTRQGSFLSLTALFVMAMLFFMETKNYLQVRCVHCLTFASLLDEHHTVSHIYCTHSFLVCGRGVCVVVCTCIHAYILYSDLTEMSLDSNKEPKVRVNFNITMMDLKCEFAVVDVVSVLGTQQNVTSHVTKWHVDAEGIRQRYQGRNREQKDIKHYDESVTESLEELHDNGEDAISLDADTFQYARKNQEFLFVDFYASWCSHCRELMPTWEVLAEVMIDVAEARFADNLEQEGKQTHDYSEADLEHAMRVHLPVMIAKVDCVDHKQLCHENMVMAYPTLRLFVDGKPWKGGDYRGHRTVVEMTDWLTQVEDSHKSEIENATMTITDAHSGTCRG